MAKATVYRMINDGAFPAPVKPTGSRMSAWPEEVVDNWICARTGANGGLQARLPPAAWRCGVFLLAGGYNTATPRPLRRGMAVLRDSCYDAQQRAGWPDSPRPAGSVARSKPKGNKGGWSLGGLLKAVLREMVGPG